jgi:hypothetical protein
MALVPCEWKWRMVVIPTLIFQWKSSTSIPLPQINTLFFFLVYSNQQNLLWLPTNQTFVWGGLHLCFLLSFLYLLWFLLNFTYPVKPTSKCDFFPDGFPNLPNVSLVFLTPEPTDFMFHDVFHILSYMVGINILGITTFSK